LQNKVDRSVDIIAQLSYFLPFNTLIILYYSLVLYMPPSSCIIGMDAAA